MAESLAEKMTREEFIERAGKVYDLVKDQRIVGYEPVTKKEGESEK